MSYSVQAQGNQFKTLIYKEELDHIAGWVQEYPDLETGLEIVCRAKCMRSLSSSKEKQSPVFSSNSA